ncbi:RluA family pseudouridine synthase [Azonexus sp. IMCC34839]|uniref:RluA family pseudouridine synthase n=1 Tax=Azonexus sp. IMCC34839 TaxID=3133695 RepID=UPI00399AB082
MIVYTPPPDTGIPVIFADDALIVADKPAGLLSVPGRGPERADCLVSRLQRDYPDALTVHRLDMSTSGLLVLARGEEMHRRLSKLFRDRLVDKRYVAVVAGLVEADSGEIDLPLIVDWPNRPRQMVDHSIGKPSLTRFRVLERDPASNTTRVELEPWTGRSHQLRVHMASLGHPILGDELYGDESSAPRLLLHALTLAFPHPLTGETVYFRAAAEF